MFVNFLMAHKVLFMFLLQLLLFSIYAHVELSEETFISLDVSRNGLEFAKDFLIETAISSLIPLRLPQIEQYVKIPFVGNVYVVLSDINIYQVNVSSSIVQPGEAGITIVASGATANLSLDWSYSYSSWLFELSDRGLASVQVEGMEIGLTIGLKNQQGTLRLSPEECGCYVNYISIKLNGGESWLYQGIVDFFEDKIASAVEDTMTSKILDGVMKIDSLFQSLPKEIKFQDLASMNITISEGPVLSNTSLLLGISGLFTEMEKIVAFAHYTNNLQSTESCNSPEKMVGISVHEKVLNSASLVYFNTNKMQWIVDKIPDQKLLNTAGWRFIIPRLYKEFPDDEMSLNFTVLSPPIIEVKNQDIVATIYSDVIISIMDAGQVIPVACISMEMKASGFAAINWSTLAGGVKLSKLSLSLKWSKIGNLHMLLVQSIMTTLLRTIILPVVTLRLKIGYSLPHFYGYGLQNATILYGDSRIMICSDIAHVHHHISPFIISQP